jgi:hypothetical protein
MAANISILVSTHKSTRRSNLGDQPSPPWEFQNPYEYILFHMWKKS